MSTGLRLMPNSARLCVTSYIAEDLLKESLDRSVITEVQSCNRGWCIVKSVQWSG